MLDKANLAPKTISPHLLTASTQISVLSTEDRIDIATNSDLQMFVGQLAGVVERLSEGVSFCYECSRKNFALQDSFERWQKMAESKNP